MCDIAKKYGPVFAFKINPLREKESQSIIPKCQNDTLKTSDIREFTESARFIIINIDYTERS